MIQVTFPKKRQLFFPAKNNRAGHTCEPFSPETPRPTLPRPPDEKPGPGFSAAPAGALKNSLFLPPPYPTFMASLKGWQKIALVVFGILFLMFLTNALLNDGWEYWIYPAVAAFAIGVTLYDAPRAPRPQTRGRSRARSRRRRRTTPLPGPRAQKTQAPRPRWRYHQLAQSPRVNAGSPSPHAGSHPPVRRPLRRTDPLTNFCYACSGLTSGKSTVSRIPRPVKAISNRSIPMPLPDVGGMPCSIASRKSSSSTIASSSPPAASRA